MEETPARNEHATQLQPFFILNREHFWSIRSRLGVTDVSTTNYARDLRLNWSEVEIRGRKMHRIHYTNC